MGTDKDGENRAMRGAPKKRNRYCWQCPACIFSIEGGNEESDIKRVNAKKWRHVRTHHPQNQHEFRRQS